MLWTSINIIILILGTWAVYYGRAATTQSEAYGALFWFLIGTVLIGVGLLSVIVEIIGGR